MVIRKFFAGFREGFKLFGRTIAFIVNFAMISVLYFTGIGLTSIACKIFGKRFLELKHDKTKKSYWESRENLNNRFERMF